MITKSEAQFCGWNSNYDSQLQEPGYVEYIQEMLDDSAEAAEKMEKEGNVLPVVIPIVFHIVHKGTSIPNGDNILYQDVEDAYNRLNSDFAGTGISFCLAQRDELGNQLDDDPTDNIIQPGVVRVDGSVIPEYLNTPISIGSPLEYEVKTLGPQFENYSYLNVWVVSDITGANTNGQVQGVGYFPHTTAPEIDGVMMRHSVFNLSTNRVLTHEVGHYLGLFHTFQGDEYDISDTPADCPSSTALFPYSDQIEDTQPHKRSPSGSCLIGDNICSPDIDNSEPNSAYDQLEDITNNHMDYSREDCRDNFTEGQKMAMLSTIESQRKGLTHSLGCVAGCNPLLLTVDFTSDPENPISNDSNGNDGEEATFTSNGVGTTYKWFVDGVLHPLENIPLEITFDSPGNHTICLLEDDGNCVIQTCKNIRVFLGGLCYDPVLDPCELLLNGNFSQHNGNPANFTCEAFNYASVQNGNYEYDLICNWYSANGSPTSLFLSNGEAAFRLYYADNSGNRDLMATQSKMLLEDGKSYELSFDLKPTVHGNSNPEFIENFQIGLTPYMPVRRNNLSNGSNVLEDFLNPIFNTGQLSNIELDVGNECKSPLGYKRYYHSFSFDSNDGNYLYFRGIPQEESGIIFIKNISIKECSFCGATPNFEWIEETCGSGVFDGKNLTPQNGGITSWSINGVTLPNSIDQEDLNFSFPFSGTYEVCMYITCENNITQEYCKDIEITTPYVHENGDIDICEFCSNPTNIYEVGARRCEDGSNEFVVDNFAMSVPKGYLPCLGDDFISKANNGTFTLNDWYIDQSDPNDDYIYVSFTFLADDPTQSMRGLLGLCDENGNSICVKLFISNPQTCDSCEDGNSFIVGDINVDCTDLDLTDNVFVYSGGFDFSPPSGTAQCGGTGTNAGLDVTIDNIPNSDGSFPITFNVSTNEMGTFNTSLNLCFTDGFSQFCYTVDIRIAEPCIPLDTDCDDFAMTQTAVKCERDENGSTIYSTDGNSVIFDIAGTLGLTTLLDEGYDFCSDKAFSSESPITDFTGVVTGTGDNLLYTFNTEIPCRDISDGLPLELTFYFCHEDGREFCYDYTILLECDGCDEGIKRSVYESADYSIYPNPNYGEFTLEFDSPEKYSNIVIRNLLGESLINTDITKTKSTFNLVQYPAGVYLVEVSGEGIKRIEKIIFVK